jgi:type II secretory pathway predicted ATPase ExeA
MRFKAALMAVFLILVLPVLALTTDEYYERATNKYLLGDFSGAAADLDEVLKIDPSYQKAIDLQKEVVRELGKTQPAAETTTTLAPVTPLIPVPPPAYVPAPQLKKFVPRRIVDEAHRLFLEGQRYYGEGDYLQARKYFQQVLELLPGHEESTGYFKKIIFEAGVSAVSQVSAEALAKEKKVESTKRYEFYFAMVSTLIALLLGLILLLALFFFARLMFFWWRSIHTYCDECGTRNSHDAEFCKKCGNRLKFTELTNEEKEWFSRFNWIKNPFTLNVIPETFAGHQPEISVIIEKLNKMSGHILIIGGLGTGKTTLLQWLEKYLKNKFETIYIMRPASRPDELIDLVSATITKKTTHTHKYTVYEFQELCKKYKRNILLLLDEAHEFNEEFEQFLRTLGDLPNIYLVMAGLPQAREKLKRDLPALFDRIVESVLLGALSFDETKEMIQKRITNAGGIGLGPFTLPAVKKIYEMSFGIPRGILKICDWVISRAVVSKKSTIDVTDIAAYEVETRSAKLPEIEISGEEVPKNE